VTHPIPLLIVGAGPYGLALSACAGRHGIEHVVVGRPLEFWKSHMPRGLYLRSGCDWHLDPTGQDTIECYLAARGLVPADVEPLSRDAYLEYCSWFQDRKAVPVRPALVRALHYVPGATPHFEAVLEDGDAIAARAVVLALGFRYFAHVPEAYAGLVPAGRLVHTCDLVDLEPMRGRRVLIIGGRQSAFETAALLREHGAAAVYLSYRHPTPAFQPSDWCWVNPIVETMASDPGWFRRLTPEEKELVGRRLWVEGRLKLEPWLAPRIAHEAIRLFPESRVVACRERPGGDLDVTLDDGTALAVDHVVLATGYRVDVERIPPLASGNLLPLLRVEDGFPVLDERFQSNLPGLFFTSMCATRDFGPFFAFTVAARASAIVIGAAVEATLRGSS
jgi:cation diffusion facilitator CzcD-associated flavoprotein CzcO